MVIKTIHLLTLAGILSALVFALSLRLVPKKPEQNTSPRHLSPHLLDNDFFASPLLLDQDLVTVFEDMNRQHERMMSKMFTFPFLDDPYVWTPQLRGSDPASTRYTFEEDDKAVTVTVKVPPKLDQNDISIQVIDGSVLHIHGAKQSSSSSGSSSVEIDKMFALGRHMDPNRIHAEFHKGQLKITAPKVEALPAKNKVRTIDVKAEL